MSLNLIAASAKESTVGFLRRFTIFVAVKLASGTRNPISPVESGDVNAKTQNQASNMKTAKDKGGI